MSERALLGWEGFEFEHPAEWAPVVLSGDRREGYLRLASASRISCHIRWKRSKTAGDLKLRLDQYVARLEKDARKAQKPFRCEFEVADERLLYRWQGELQGRGALFHSARCSRVFFMEVVGGRKDALLPCFKATLDSFRSDDASFVTWSLLGLHVRLPAALAVQRKILQAGKTHMTLSARGARVRAERWGFATQLLAKHRIEDWSRAVLEMPRAMVKQEACGLRLREQGGVRGWTEALVKLDPEQNQLTLVKCKARQERWGPQWEWLP